MFCWQRWPRTHLQCAAAQWDGNSTTSAVIVCFRKSHLAFRGAEDVTDCNLLKECEEENLEVSCAKCVSFFFMYY